MTKANALRGWRSPEEKPVKGERLLLVIQSRTDKLPFIIALKCCTGLDDFSDDVYELLAWQYCPIWDEEGKE